MKELVKVIGNSKLMYNDDLGEFEVHRFDEVIGLGDITEEQAIKEVEEIEE